MSDASHVGQSLKKYWTIGAVLFVFTVITVAVNRVHLAIPLAITVALIIAATKGSMVAAIFMHLNHEKKWIYGALLLTVVFFVVLLFLPLLTVSGTIGTRSEAARAAAGATEAGH